MKKFILSSFVIVSFIIYALVEKMSGIRKTVSLTPRISAGAGNPAVTPAVGLAYKDGEYTGNVTDAFYGNIQVKAVINNGKISDVQFLEYPHDRGTSIAINTDAMPLLKAEAIKNQSAQVDVISGATATSQAFIQSLQSALDQAR